MEELENENSQILEVERQKKTEKKRFIQGLATGLLLAAFGICIGILGRQFYLYKQMEKAQMAAQTNETAESEEDTSVVNSTVLSKMNTLQSIIDKYYYLADVDTDTLADGVYEGMIASLGDKYAAYYTAEELKDTLDSNEGIYFGIGAYISLDKETSYPKLASIIDNTPAQEAGLRADDIIYQVDGVSTYGMELSEVVSKVKGEEGTTVNLTIIREGENAALEVPVERRKVESPTVTYEMKEDSIGYIQIIEFDDVTVDQFADALATLRGQGAKGIIIDLRGNPGGLLTSVVSIGQQILPEGNIVYTEDKAGNKEEYKSDGTHKLDLPLVVLVDKNSASAAEILSGAIKDYKLGTLVGTTTYGKGIVQKILSLKDGTAVKFTVSAYYTPNGTNIQGTGIEPDVTVDFDGEKYYADGTDNQLNKGIEVIKEKMQ